MSPVVSLDWLSIFCNLTSSRLYRDDSFSWTEAGFECVYTDKRSASFDVIHEVSYGGCPFAVVQSRPHSRYIAEDCGVVKFDNAVLYLPTFSHLFRLFCTIMRLSILSISRMDVCCDMLSVAGGSLHHFANRVLSGEVRRSRQSSFFAVANDPTDIRGVVQVKQGLRGGKGFVVLTDVQVQQSRGVVSYVCWGTRRSDVRFYIYDKTLELKQKKDKPYIRDAWLAAGWNGRDVVYRAEFSVQSSRLVDKEVGDLRLTLLRLLQLNDIPSIFVSLAAKYARFALNDAVRFCDCTPIEVLPRVSASNVFSVASKENMHSVSVADRIYFRMLYERLSFMPPDLRKQLLPFIESDLARTRLSEWAGQHGYNFGAKSKSLGADLPLQFEPPKPSERIDAVFVKAAGVEFNMHGFGEEQCKPIDERQLSIFPDAASEGDI